jgi:hypothetical protein
VTIVAGPCSDDFVRLADELGGISCDAHPAVTLRAPWDLTNWTLPVVELLLVASAAVALVHAIAMLRRRAQPAWLGLWAATVVYVFAIEPVLYFPEQFGLEDVTGLIFVHNTFTIDLLYDRLPLYIIALYPSGIYLAHALVDSLGVFRRHGIVVGAVTVGAVHHLFYEIFDQLGPQLRWWVWNLEADTNHPLFGSVPLSSATFFATTSPAILVGFARWLLFRDGTDRSRASWMVRSVVVGLCTVALQPIAGLPTSVLGAIDGDDTVVDQIALWTVIGLVMAVAAWAVATSRPFDDPDRRFRSWILDHYETVVGSVYLATFVVLWATALPELLDATDGRTADGSATGNPLYAAACAVVAAGLLFRSTRTSSRADAPEDHVTGPLVSP